MKLANLALRFLLELCALAALACWGLKAGDGVALGVVLALAAVGLFVAAWGRWIAPKASHRLEDPARLGAELTLFAVAIVALAAAGQSGLAIAFAVVLALNELGLHAWRQRQTA